jgi:hypothetical protein
MDTGSSQGVKVTTNLHGAAVENVWHYTSTYKYIFVVSCLIEDSDIFMISHLPEMFKVFSVA